MVALLLCWTSSSSCSAVISPTRRMKKQICSSHSGNCNLILTMNFSFFVCLLTSFNLLEANRPDHFKDACIFSAFDTRGEGKILCGSVQSYLGQLEGSEVRPAAVHIMDFEEFLQCEYI